ncbi:hypothetical protein M885DRAFT_3069 [Pelagophyceae sp. CCMP2097]|nr:hypothetical protein M885DRAFT_3069 [Pelagophyceae sp. CCMP2097]
MERPVSRTPRTGRREGIPRRTLVGLSSDSQRGPRVAVLRRPRRVDPRRRRVSRRDPRGLLGGPYRGRLEERPSTMDDDDPKSLPLSRLEGSPRARGLARSTRPERRPRRGISTHGMLQRVAEKKTTLQEGEARGVAERVAERLFWGGPLREGLATRWQEDPKKTSYDPIQYPKKTPKETPEKTHVSQVGASRIIVVDVNPDKFEIARTLGATDCLNPMDSTTPIEQRIVQMTQWGCDYTFDCTGNVKVRWFFGFLIFLIFWRTPLDVPSPQPFSTAPRGESRRGPIDGGGMRSDAVLWTVNRLTVPRLTVPRDALQDGPFRWPFETAP